MWLLFPEYPGRILRFLSVIITFSVPEDVTSQRGSWGFMYIIKIFRGGRGGGWGGGSSEGCLKWGGGGGGH